MLSIQQQPTRTADGISRRELMRIGALGCAGLSLPNLLQAASANETDTVAGPAFGQAKNIIFLYLAGGPPQHETFDPRPDAPVEIRGPFNPISTNIPGIQICELLPRTAALADKFAIVRSMSTDDNIHSSSGAWVLTGSKYIGPNARTITPTDWPYFGSIIKMLRPSDRLPALSTVWLPDRWRLNESVTPAGQTGGFAGSRWTPEFFVGDPSEPSYEIESLRQTDIDATQFRRRRSLLSQLATGSSARSGGGATGAWDLYQQQAFDLLTSGKAREAFEINREPDTVRDRYGRNRWGQCVLLARRLIEAGVRLVHVQWPREPGDNAVDNPLWDTHAQNADRVEDVLCPMFDVGYSALLDDLDQRGLLNETLVVAIGEFGRTPKINAKGGRDHWGHVFNCTLAGAGIAGGQVLGTSDKTGGYPTSERVQPGDLAATMFHLLGINYQGSFPDPLGRPHRLTDGEPMWKLIGAEPATTRRTQPTGDVARVPDYDQNRLLINTDFTGTQVLKPVTAPSRPKGWRVHPDPGTQSPTRIETRLQDDGQDATATLGLHADSASTGGAIEIPPGAFTSITQEVISPFAGTFTFRAKLRGEGESADAFESIVQKHFVCRLALRQFVSQKKNARECSDLATIDVKPEFHADSEANGGWRTFELTKRFENPTPGGNFSFGSGLAVAIQLIRNTPGVLRLEPAQVRFAFIRVAEVWLEFSGKERDPNVTV